LKSTHQLSKYNWINFSRKQRSFYFTKSSRRPDSTSQRAGFGPRAVCLTPLVQIFHPVNLFLERKNHYQVFVSDEDFLSGMI